MSQRKDFTGDGQQIIKTNAFQSLLDYLSRHKSLNLSDIELLGRHADLLFIKKDEILLEKGRVSDRTHFVVKGIFRAFNRDSEGEEINFGFYSENWWVSDAESFAAGTPSDNIIQALEDSTILSFKKDDFLFMMEHSPALFKISYDLLQKNAASSKNRVYHQIKDSPAQRYQYFLDHYGDVANRIPLYMIASFLGISRKTLTRVRGGK